MVLWLAKQAPTASTTKAQVGAMLTVVTPHGNKVYSLVVSVPRNWWSALWRRSYVTLFALQRELADI